MKRLDVFLLLALLASVALNLAIRDHPARPNREFVPEMVRTVRYNAFSPNPNFPDGKTLQPPVPGTIPRAVAADPDSTGERGAFVFQTFCTPCHGGAGKGDGTVVQHGYAAPPSLLAGRAAQLTDSQIFEILTRGQKNMPSYASQLSEQDRWNVIRHVRSIERSASQP